MTAPTVALVDDHQLLVETVSLALAGHDIACVPVRPRPIELLAGEILALEADLVLLDLDLGPFGDATGAIGPLTSGGARVLVLSGLGDPIRLAQALDQGAIGVQSKADGFEALVQTTCTVLRTGAAPNPLRARQLAADLAEHRARLVAERQPFESLTERERAVLAELTRGLTVQQIAAGWVVSPATVRSHVQSVLTKLQVVSQLQAVVKATAAGWLSADDIGAG